MAKKPKVPPGTWIERDMFESKAFMALKGFAPQLLVLFLSKRQFITQGRKGKQKRICTNNDNITMTYIELNRYGISKPRISRAFHQLLEKGFITVVHLGGTFRHDKSIYALSDNWLLWQPGIVFKTREIEKVKRGFCKPKK
jgi:hypothetical protein